MNEIPGNEEVVVEVIEETAGGNIGKIVVVAAGALGGAVALYKVGKWLATKIKDKKAKSEDTMEVYIVDPKDVKDDE